MARYGKAAGAKVERAMKERKAGKLRSGRSGRNERRNVRIQLHLALPAPFAPATIFGHTSDRSDKCPTRGGRVQP